LEIHLFFYVTSCATVNKIHWLKHNKQGIENLAKLFCSK
jgi:hypothetical protein